MQRFPAATIALISLALTLGACGRKTPEAGRSGRSGPPALRVRVAPAEVRDVVYDIRALGSLEAEDLVQVTAEVEGAVSEVRFREGDRVTPETILVRIDPERFRLEAARAEAAHRQAVAEYHRAASDLKRRQELASDHLLSAEELNRAGQETERLEAQVAAAKAALDIAIQNQRRADVRAPRGGVVNSRSVNTGQYVRIANVLATLVDPSRLNLRFKVSEAESLRAREGQTVSFRVAALGKRDFAAAIFHVSDVADPTTRQVEIVASVRNPGVLKPGFFAEVTLATESRKGAIVVPAAAVAASDRGFVTYVVAEGKAQLRPVALGLRTEDGAVEILSGLKTGETVVVEGSDRLADGVAVQADDAPAPESPDRAEARR